MVIVEFPTLYMGDMLDSMCDATFAAPVPVANMPFIDPSFFVHADDNGVDRLFAIKTLQCVKQVKKVGIGAPINGVLTAYAGMLTIKVFGPHRPSK